jgi:uncharacterized membrane protein
MEDILLVLLCAAVIYLLVLQWIRGKRLNDLQNRLDLLERTTRQSPPASIASAAATPTPILPFRPPVPLEPYPVPPPARSRSIEERLGQNWLNKLGIVILVIGIALFLGYQLRTLGPLGKSLIGLTLSLGLLGGGLLLERRTRYRLFARAAIGGGWALTFFVTFALYHLPSMQVLHSQSTDLILMLLVAAAMVAHSLLYQSQVVTTLAFLLAFITVGISEITLFSLVASALLAIALVYISARQAWFALAFAGLLGVYFNHFLWLQRVLPTGAHPGHPFHNFIPSALLLLLYWLLFRILYLFRIPTNRGQATLATLTAITNSIGLLSLLKFQSSRPDWAFYALLTLGTAEFLLAFIARRLRPTYPTAFILLSTIASILLLAAIPFRFDGTRWSDLWLLQAELLFLAGARLHERLFRRLGLLAGFAVTLQLFITATIRIATNSHAPRLALTLFAATVLFWFNAEFSPLLWPSRWEFKSQSPTDLVMLRVTSFLATVCTALGLQLLIPTNWITLSWAALALLTLALGWVLNRPSFIAQSIAVLFATALRFAFTLIHLPTFALNTQQLLHRAPPVLMFVSLPIAFAIRRQRSHEGSPTNTPIAFLLVHPEQPFFFAPLLLVTLLLAVDLRAGIITIGWGALGVLVFFFALAVKERSFRLAGLFLLLLAVAKILLIDVWHASPTDRYITLIVIGAALLLVSFLYSRYRETLLKFL